MSHMTVHHFAMLGISAAYAAMRCPSLPVTFVDSVKTNKHRPVFKKISPSASHTILFFSVPNIIAIFRRASPFMEASNASGVGRNRDSRQISGSIGAVNGSTANNAIHTAATDRGKLMTLVADKRRRFFHRKRGSVYDKKPQRYAKTLNAEAWVTIIKDSARGITLLKLTTWRTQSTAWPLRQQRDTCRYRDLSQPLLPSLFHFKIKTHPFHGDSTNLSRHRLLIPYPPYTSWSHVLCFFSSRFLMFIGFLL